jgi:hypothetical protein
MLAEPLVVGCGAEVGQVEVGQQRPAAHRGTERQRGVRRCLGNALKERAGGSGRAGLGSSRGTAVHPDGTGNRGDANLLAGAGQPSSAFATAAGGGWSPGAGRT